jgi:tetrahydromethanopterin S-methyltransferase subunit A
LDGLDAEAYASAAPLRTERIRPDEFAAENWPVQPGDYVVLNPEKAVAIAVLGGADIDGLASDLTGSGVAIIGGITTENLGVEHLVKNIIANPFIRHLVIWGEDVKGHRPGNALLSLLQNGMDKRGRIIGARGARPVLKNITDEEVRHFRQQITIVDLIDRKEVDELTTQIAVLQRRPVQPCEAGLRVDAVAIQKAAPARRLKLDPNGYFVVMVMKNRENPLIVEHYGNDGILRNLIEGKDAASICATLIEQNLVSQLDHAAYLGRELAKAELSIRMDSKYTQDRAQGELL